MRRGRPSGVNPGSRLECNSCPNANPGSRLEQILEAGWSKSCSEYCSSAGIHACPILYLAVFCILCVFCLRTALFRGRSFVSFVVLTMLAPRVRFERPVLMYVCMAPRVRFERPVLNVCMYSYVHFGLLQNCVFCAKCVFVIIPALKICVLYWQNAHNQFSRPPNETLGGVPPLRSF